MTPAHDERSSIAAKGLTGEGYKGHVFWDTEVFLLPFHLFSDPTIARSLLRYRWQQLARRAGESATQWLAGRALFPWKEARSAKKRRHFAAINIRTGLRQKWPRRRRNISRLSDIIAPAGYSIPADHGGWRSFIAHEALGATSGTAKFWISRAVRVNDRLEIHGCYWGLTNIPGNMSIIHAFTSYMAYYNVQQALSIARQFGCSDDAFIPSCRNVSHKNCGLPGFSQDGVLPQDDSVYG